MRFGCVFVCISIYFIRNICRFILFRFMPSFRFFPKNHKKKRIIKERSSKNPKRFEIKCKISLISDHGVHINGILLGLSLQSSSSLFRTWRGILIFVKGKICFVVTFFTVLTKKNPKLDSWLSSSMRAYFQYHWRWSLRSNKENDNFKIGRHYPGANRSAFLPLVTVDPNSEEPLKGSSVPKFECNAFDAFRKNVMNYVVKHECKPISSNINYHWRMTMNKL